MKITVYTITDCEFSKQEKEYLTSHQLQFEEKNLETNKEFLTEMLAVSNNFAGTPVTKIEKDDGKIEVLKGFTKEDFDKTFGFTEEKKPAEDVKVESTAAPVPPIPAEQPPTPTTQPPAPTVQPVAPAPEQSNDQLNSILQDLQAKSVAANPNPTSPPAPETTSQTSPSAGLPNVPDFQK